MAEAKIFSDSEELVRAGIDHLGRFSFQNRHNPFVSSRAALDLRPARHRQLVQLLDGVIDPREWLEGPGRAAMRGVKIGLVPRGPHLVAEQGKLVAGIESVHAFLQAPLFWWLVSILWTITMSRSVDPLLGDGVKGYRTHPKFLKDPDSEGRMLSSSGFGSWLEFPGEVAEASPGVTLAANKVDVRAFYYSIDAGPRQILNRFFASRGARAPQTRHARVLTTLLEALHQRCAERCAEIAPRRADLGYEGDSPLPVGPPSSQLLANMVMALVIDEIEANEEVLGAAAYADDVIVMTPALPEIEEGPAAYLARLGLCGEAAPHKLQADSLQGIARLQLNIEKCEITYSRREEGAQEPAAGGLAALIGQFAAGDWDPYLESDPEPEWGGTPVTTVLRLPGQRAAVPQQLVNDIRELVGEIRVGLTPEELQARYEQLRRGLDHGHLLALQPYWRELLVIAIVTKGIEEVEVLTAELRAVIEALRMPSGANKKAREALDFGLRASWVQSLAQAIAVATDKGERAALLDAMPEIDLPAEPASTKTTIEHAMRIRERRLLPSSLVAAPLAEFTDWPGRLIGKGAFGDFIEWSRQFSEDAAEQLAAAVERAVRFIPLHESCLAIHLWAGLGREDWLELAFRVLGAQPLMQASLVAQLQGVARKHLDLDNHYIGNGYQQMLTVGMPSLEVNEKQLKLLLAEDWSGLGRVFKKSRADLSTILDAAAVSRARFLVLPEWSVVAQQLPELFQRSRQERMLVIAGQAPEVISSVYRNSLWTGIPIVDAGGHRACLVPPARQKHFLSPEEEKLLGEHGAVAATPSEEVSVYNWRGIRFGSLICFEFADVGVRQELRFKADLVTVSSLNHDWRYFDAVQDATTRDNYCLAVCVNTGTYPGTRITRPTSSEMAEVASVHGSGHPVLITKRIDMTPIVAAQIAQKEPEEATVIPPLDGITLKDYKPFPPTWQGDPGVGTS
ncbi:MAG TPA: hypothetical protein VNO20_01780 [Solirubrobacterales bacterium]|nr:hypothetical protein [Solirubrobacterales bacterium]